MKEPARTLLEALLVAAAVLGGGLAANGLNPQGLSLTQDYFRTATPETPVLQKSGTIGLPEAPTAMADSHAGSPAGRAAAGVTGVTGVTGATPALGETSHPGAAPATGATPDVAADLEADPETVATIERLREHGLQVTTHAEARALFEDPAYAAGAYVFVDARGDDAYRDGHVPGAVQFDRYHPGKHIDAVQAACAGALKVVVYCIGGHCEDSEMAALDLAALGIDPRSVSVYAGGWTAWTAAGLPAERGERGGSDG